MKYKVILKSNDYDKMEFIFDVSDVAIGFMEMAIQRSTEDINVSLETIKKEDKEEE